VPDLADLKSEAMGGDSTAASLGPCSCLWVRLLEWRDGDVPSDWGDVQDPTEGCIRPLCSFSVGEFAVGAGVTDGSERNKDALTPHTLSHHGASGPGLGLSLNYLLIYPCPKAGLGVSIHCGLNHCRAMVAEVWYWW